MPELRYFTPEGRTQWATWLTAVKADGSLALPAELLTNPDCTRRGPGSQTVELGETGTKFELAQMLAPKIAAVREARLPASQWPGLWDWLAAFYFDLICPTAASGKRTLGELERYVWVPIYTRYYKHRIGGTVAIYEAFHDASWVFLCGAPSILSDYEIQLGSRASWLSITAIGELMNALYYDLIAGKTKRGGMSKTAPGALFHLLRVLAHLERTYDLWSMQLSELRTLLPRQFGRWVPTQQVMPYMHSAPLPSP